VSDACLNCSYDVPCKMAPLLKHERKVFDFIAISCRARRNGLDISNQHAPKPVTGDVRNADLLSVAVV